MSTTEHADYKFTVKEGAPNVSGGVAPTWIMCEPGASELSIVGSGYLGFRLRAGTSVEEAHAVAAYLQRHIASVSYTRP